MPSIRFVSTALIVSVFVTAGCGSSKSSGNTDGTLTRSQLISRADAICYAVNSKRTSSKIPSNAAFARVVAPLAAVEREKYSELAKLVPPSSMASDWNRLVSAAKSTTEITTKFGEAAAAKNLKGAVALYPTLNRHEGEMIAIAQRDGFKDCAQLRSSSAPL